MFLQRQLKSSGAIIVEFLHFNLVRMHTAHTEYRVQVLRVHDVTMSHCVDYVLHLHSNIQGDYF